MAALSRRFIQQGSKAGECQVVDTAGTEWVSLNVCGTPISTSMRTLKAFPNTFFTSVLELPPAVTNDPVETSNAVGQPSRSSGSETVLEIDLDYSVEAVHVLLATLRAGRTSVNMAFRAVQAGIERCFVEVSLLFDYVGLSWLLPTHLPSEFDDPAVAMSVRFEQFDFSKSCNSMDMAGVLNLFNIQNADRHTSERPSVPMCAVVNHEAAQLNTLDVSALAARDSSWLCGKLVYMPILDNTKLVLDLGPGSALFPTGFLMWIHPPPQGLLNITVSAFSEVTGERRVILNTHMLEFSSREDDTSKSYILCRAPITPSLRELYRMFRFSLHFEQGEGENDVTSKLVELELFGDYVRDLTPEVLTSQPDRFHFQESYADFTQGRFVPEM